MDSKEILEPSVFNRSQFLIHFLATQGETKNNWRKNGRRGKKRQRNRERELLGPAKDSRGENLLQAGFNRQTYDLGIE